MNLTKQLLIAQITLNPSLVFWTDKLQSESKARIHLRNRAVEHAFRAIDSAQPVNLYHPRLIPDIATCQDRADHYGVKVGSAINLYRQKRPNYTATQAGIIRKLRSIAVDVQLSASFA